jgi:uncharacterized DUF497 family protein
LYNECNSNGKTAQKTGLTNGSTVGSRSRPRHSFFDDPQAIFRKDRIVSGELRWHALGALGAVQGKEDNNGEEETIRIISAREANPRERRIYVQQEAE